MGLPTDTIFVEAKEPEADERAVAAGTRLSELIALLRFPSQKAFAAAMSVGEQTITAWVNGHAKPQTSRLAQMAMMSGIPLGVLKAYLFDGEPLPPLTIRGGAPASSTPGVNGNRRPKPGNRIPLVNSIAAGWGSERTDLDHGDWADAWIDRGDIADPDARAFKIEGDSMEPAFPSGEIVVTSPALAESVKPGTPCVVQFAPDRNSENCIRYVHPGAKPGTVELRPHNPKYSARVVTREEIAYLWPIVEARRKVVW